MATARLARHVIFLVIFFSAFLIVLRGDVPGVAKNVISPTAGPILKTAGLPPANSTLGFGAIIAVSRPGSARQEELLLAGNVTGLDIDVPLQPAWNDSDVNALKASRGSSISRGSALAWLGHINALRWFMDTNLTTVLILEDDVDWDIHLRTEQIPQVAATTRYLLSNTMLNATAPPPPPSSHAPTNPDEYWGPMDTWDLMYLGHCGENFTPGKWNFRVPRAGFHDPTLPARNALHSTTRGLFDALAIPEQTRLVHRSIGPLCTFGFALTRLGAERLLYDIAPRELEGGTMAYDVRVLEACRDEGLRCWSTNPELFHHTEGGSEIEKIDESTNSTMAAWQRAEQRRKRKGGSRVRTYEEMHRTRRDKERMRKAERKAAKARLELEARKKRERERLRAARDREAAGQKALKASTRRVMVKKKARVGVDQPGAPNIRCGARMGGVKSEDRGLVEYLKQRVGRDGRCVRDVELEKAWEERVFGKGKRP